MHHHPYPISTTRVILGNPRPPSTPVTKTLASAPIIHLRVSLPLRRSVFPPPNLAISPQNPASFAHFRRFYPPAELGNLPPDPIPPRSSSCVSVPSSLRASVPRTWQSPPKTRKNRKTIPNQPHKQLGNLPPQSPPPPIENRKPKIENPPPRQSAIGNRQSAITSPPSPAPTPPPAPPIPSAPPAPPPLIDQIRAPLRPPSPPPAAPSPACWPPSNPPRSPPATPPPPAPIPLPQSPPPT